MYKVKEVSKILNISEHTIRYYSDLGLIPNEKRDTNNSRLYDERSIDWLRGVCYLRETGMTLEDVKEYVTLLMDDSSESLNRRVDLLAKTYDVSLLELEKAKHRTEYLKSKLERAKDIASHKIVDDKNPHTKKY